MAGYITLQGNETQRHSWFMERNSENIINPVFPEGYSLMPMRRGQEEQAWCDVSNSCFSYQQGHVDMQAEQFLEEIGCEDYVEGGLMMLWHESKAIGIVRVSRNIENGAEYAFITYLSVLPAYQGKGLGKNLLRAALQFSRDMGFDRIGLDVSASNERAVSLYISEGFEKVGA